MRDGVSRFVGSSLCEERASQPAWRRPSPPAWRLPSLQSVSPAAGASLTSTSIGGPGVVGLSAVTARVCAALCVLLATFTAAFSALERWSLVDSLYFTSTTLATIGFGDLRPQRRVSKLLTSVLGACGVGLLGGLVSAVVGEWLRVSSAGVGAAEQFMDCSP